MMLISFEGVTSHAMNQLFMRLRRRLQASGPACMLPVDVAGAQCPYVKAFRVFEALGRCRNERVVLSPVSFYDLRSDARTFSDFANALQRDILPAEVGWHLMFVLAGDPHELLDEYLARGAITTLEEIVAGNARALDAAKQDRHPWMQYSVVIPVPRHVLDTDALLDDLANDMLRIVLKYAVA